MTETSERLTTENEMMEKSIKDPAPPLLAVKNVPITDETQRLQPWREKLASSEDQDIAEAEASDHSAINGTEKKHMDLEVELPTSVDQPVKKANPKKNHDKKATPTKPTTSKKQDEAHVSMLLERCRNVCIALFYREHAPVRSLGFTSSIQGEGKSFLAAITAQVLAHDSSEPVTLLECNWEHPTLHEHFDIPANPGLAEWLRGTCSEDDIRYQVDRNLTVIPAGNGSHDAVKLLNQLNENGLQKAFKQTNELFIVDLPSIITTGYGSLAASLVEAVVLIVRAQAISESMVIETCSQLNDSSIHGIILNQVDSHIPRWLRQIL
ncbi:MAG: CpsD/CapB family tyrosine-protein kinase [Ktedonobacteraceae bacterium]